MGSLLQHFVDSKRISNNDSDNSNKTPTRAGDDSKKKN